MREKIFCFFLGLLPPAMAAYILFMHEQNKQLREETARIKAETDRLIAENEDIERQIDFWNNMTRVVEKLSDKE